jgi:hypothetical protein
MTSIFTAVLYTQLALALRTARFNTGSAVSVTVKDVNVIAKS